MTHFKKAEWAISVAKEGTIEAVLSDISNITVDKRCSSTVVVSYLHFKGENSVIFNVSVAWNQRLVLKFLVLSNAALKENPRGHAYARKLLEGLRLMKIWNGYGVDSVYFHQFIRLERWIWGKWYSNKWVGFSVDWGGCYRDTTALNSTETLTLLNWCYRKVLVWKGKGKSEK